MIRGYGETRDRICMKTEVRDEIRFRALMHPVASNKAVSAGSAAADRPLMRFRSEVALEILASVEVHVL